MINTLFARVSHWKNSVVENCWNGFIQIHLQLLAIQFLRLEFVQNFPVFFCLLRILSESMLVVLVLYIKNVVFPFENYIPWISETGFWALGIHCKRWLLIGSCVKSRGDGDVEVWLRHCKNTSVLFLQRVWRAVLTGREQRRWGCWGVTVSPLRILLFSPCSLAVLSFPLCVLVTCSSQSGNWRGHGQHEQSCVPLTMLFSDEHYDVCLFQPYILPTIQGKHQDLKSISTETVSCAGTFLSVLSPSPKPVWCCFFVVFYTASLNQFVGGVFGCVFVFTLLSQTSLVVVFLGCFLHCSPEPVWQWCFWGVYLHCSPKPVWRCV